MSNARMNGSHVPAMNTRPPAVTIGPPRLMVPGGTFGFAGLKLPSGTCQRIVPDDRSSAVSAPQGGAMHGSPLGDIRNARNMPYGVPACPVYSPFSVRCAGSLKTAWGTSFTFAARLFEIGRAHV